ncbi:MAG: permease-like cell division protein FtsX [Patescibacteria group bacterium]
MFWTKLKRVFKSGFINFWRNGVVSLAAMLVVSATLFVIGSIVLGNALTKAALDEIKEKVDVNVYMRVDAKEPDILALRDSLSKLPQVSKVEYVSSEEALAEFKERHKDNTLILESLEEVGGNPLGATLNIKAKDPSEYENIAKFLESDSALAPGGASIIDKVNYRQNKLIIDRLTNIIDSAHTLGYALTLLFILMSVTVTIGTIRLAIYTAREEISVMKLVGASSNYVRGPFIVEGLMYGVLSALIVVVLFYPVALWVGSATEGFFGGINLLTYYRSNFFELLAILLLSGSLLGTVSSWLATQRYLKV